MATSSDKSNGGSAAVEIFISYSHKDAELLPELHDALATLRRLGFAIYWDDRKIDGGDDWSGRIDEHLNTADIILLLISSGFIASDFCYDVEMNRAIQRHEANEAAVIPVLLKPCDWKDLPFAKLQGLPEDWKAVTKWEDRDEAWTNVAVGIRKVVEKTHRRKAPRKRPAGMIDRVRTPPKPLPSPRGPVALPAIWNVPHNRNAHFTGREEMLAKLHEALQAGGSAALTQAITGLGGVGKTQTAIEYVYRCTGEYDLVWWIRSEEPAKLAANYAGLAKHLGIAEEKDLKLTVEAVRAELARQERWLLVFDNANHVDEVRGYLPQGGQGAVLITSRDPNWSEVADSLGITTWPRGDSVKFLLDRTGQTDSTAANELAEALGDLPLALEQAAAYCAEMGKSFGDYLPLLRERTREVLRSGKAPAGYHATVATTWELAFAQAEKKSEAAGQLMNLCAFLAPDDIGREMLRAGAEHLPSPLTQAVADDLLWNEAVGALRGYSLVDVKNEAISVHRLVQAVVRDRLDEAGRKRWAEGDVMIVNASFPQQSDDVRTWAACARLLPHAQAAAGHAEELKVGSEACGQVLNRTGMYLQCRGEFLQAKALYERALKLGEEANGPDHPWVGTYVNNLGIVLNELGDLKGARAHLERALKIDEAAYGPNDPKVAISVNNLGRVLRDLGDLKEARAHFERALKIDEVAYGPYHPKMAIRVNNLGIVLNELGDLKGARAHLERALEIDELAYGPDHPKVAIRVNNLGLILQDLGDLEEARAHLERALRIDEVAYGPDHPNVGIDVSNLGRVLKASGDLEGARDHFARAVRIDEAAYGPDHPNVAIDVNNLGSVMQDLGDLEGARTCFERALRIREQSLGRDHPKTQLARRNLESLDSQ